MNNDMNHVEEPTTNQSESVTHSLRYGIPINYRWLVEFVLLPFIVAGGMMWLTAINTKIAQIQVDVVQLQNNQIENRTNISNINSKIDKEVTSRLDRIDAKLDALIDRQFGTRFLEQLQ